MREKYEYNTPEHEKEMDALFPEWLEYFSQELWETGLSVSISPWQHENKEGVELSIAYDKSFLEDKVSDKLDPGLSKLTTCKIGLFFNDWDIIVSSIQWQSFSDKLWSVFLAFFTDRSKVITKEDFDSLNNDYKKQKNIVQKKLRKILWLSQHHFTFLLASLLGVALKWKNIKMINKVNSRSIYTKQDKTWDQKLKENIPELEISEQFVARNKNQVIECIAKLPEKQQELLFWFFDNLQDFLNKKEENPIKDLDNEIKGELIGAIREARRDRK